MYSRDFHSDSVPPGYGGSAFSRQENCGEEPECGAPPCPPCDGPEPQEHKPPNPPKPPHRGILPPRWEKFCADKIGGIWNGDLLLLVVAILLMTGRGDDCEENDDDLWLLLLLLYFMK